MKQNNTSPRLCSQFSWSIELSEILSEENINKESRNCGFVNRLRKLLPIAFVKMCCFWNWQESFPSLKRQCQWLLENCKIGIKDQSLNERFGAASVNLIQQIMGRVSKIRTEQKLQVHYTELTQVLIFQKQI